MSSNNRPFFEESIQYAWIESLQIQLYWVLFLKKVTVDLFFFDIFLSIEVCDCQIYTYFLISANNTFSVPFRIFLLHRSIFYRTNTINIANVTEPEQRTNMCTIIEWNQEVQNRHLLGIKNSFRNDNGYGTVKFNASINSF